MVPGRLATEPAPTSLSLHNAFAALTEDSDDDSSRPMSDSDAYQYASSLGTDDRMSRWSYDPYASSGDEGCWMATTSVSTLGECTDWSGGAHNTDNRRECSLRDVRSCKDYTTEYDKACAAKESNGAPESKPSGFAAPGAGEDQGEDKVIHGSDSRRASDERAKEILSKYQRVTHESLEYILEVWVGSRNFSRKKVNPVGEKIGEK